MARGNQEPLDPEERTATPTVIPVLMVAGPSSRPESRRSDPCCMSYGLRDPCSRARSCRSCMPAQLRTCVRSCSASAPRAARVHRRSSSGIVISLVLNAISGNAFTQTTSSCQAELNAFFEAALLVDFYLDCLRFLAARCSR